MNPVNSILLTLNLASSLSVPATTTTTPIHPTKHVHQTPFTCDTINHASWTPREVKCAIRRVFKTSGHQTAALNIARCESGFDRYNVNPSSGAAGPFQVIKYWHPDAPDPFDVVPIARWVRRITRDGTNWSAWVCRP